MSKEAAMRAMREARYRERSAGAAAGSAPVRPAVRPAKVVKASSAGSPEPGADLCGHRSMNGRTCTREHGHEAKSHRYS